MFRIVIFIATLFAVLLGVNAWCSPWKSGGTLNVCKQRGKVDCRGVSSSDTCINLIGGPFLSGFTGGGYQCDIFDRDGCQGTRTNVDRAGFSSFPFTPKSFRCPCI